MTFPTGCTSVLCRLTGKCRAFGSHSVGSVILLLFYVNPAPCFVWRSLTSDLRKVRFPSCGDFPEWLLNGFCRSPAPPRKAAGAPLNFPVQHPQTAETCNELSARGACIDCVLKAFQVAAASSLPVMPGYKTWQLPSTAAGDTYLSGKKPRSLHP